MRNMDARKEVAFTMDEIKELNFQLQVVIEKLEQQLQNADGKEKMPLEEKIVFIREILQKLNG